MSKLVELLRADNAVIEDAVGHADPMILRGLLYYLTGDESLAEIQSTIMRMGSAELCVVTEPDKVDMLRHMAVRFLQDHRDAQKQARIAHG